MKENFRLSDTQWRGADVVAGFHLADHQDVSLQRLASAGIEVASHLSKFRAGAVAKLPRPRVVPRSTEIEQLRHV
jgi:hypothetical protein